MTIAPYEGQAIVQRDTVDGWASMLTTAVELGNIIAETDFVPSALRGSGPAVAACILAGRELGIGPMTALQHLYVIEGRPSQSAQLMRALVLRAGHHFEVVELTNTRCTVEGRRKGSTGAPKRVTWTLDDARRAGLDGRPIWRKYPRAQLLARATAELCRALFPDVLGGVQYTVEEAQDMALDAGQQPEPPSSVSGAVIQREQPAAPPMVLTTQQAPQAQAQRQAAPTPPAEQPAAQGQEVELDEPAPTPRQESLSRARAALDAEQAPEQPAQPAAPQQPPMDADAPVTRDQEGMVFALLKELNAGQTRDERLRITQGLLSRRVTSFRELSVRDAGQLIDTLVRAKESQEPGEWLEYLVDQGLEALELVENAPTNASDAQVIEGRWDEQERDQ